LSNSTNFELILKNNISKKLNPKFEEVPIQENKDLGFDFLNQDEETTNFEVEEKKEEEDEDFNGKDFLNNNSYKKSLIKDNDNFKLKEKHLHPLLVKYLMENDYFKAHSKTIDQSKSRNTLKGRNEWDHADIVAVSEEIHLNSQDFLMTEFLDIANQNFLKIFSFELKLKIDLAHLREYFFQAVSNSSWANEGYLVTMEFSGNQRIIKQELKRLSSTFGIGVILIDPFDLQNTEIVFPAKRRETLDISLIHKILTISKNKDFIDFIKTITDIKKTQRVVPEDFDDVLNEEDYHKLLNNYFVNN